MATTKGIIEFNGSIGNLTAYRMRGVDRLIIRQRKGPTRKVIETSPSYANLRLNNKEWKGCAVTGQEISRAIHAVRHLADYNYTGPLYAICKNIQMEDEVSLRGQRGIQLSTFGYRIDGFNLNRFNTFDQIVRSPAEFTIDKAGGSAQLNLPEMIPDINLRNPLKQPLFRFVYVLGTIADQVYSERMLRYEPVSEQKPSSVKAYSSWYNWQAGCEPQSIDLALNNWQEQEGLSLILAVGIEYGAYTSANKPRFVKYAGAGKILKVM